MDTMLLEVDEACAQLRVRRSTLYKLIGKGQLGSVLIGRRRLIPADSLRAFVQRLQNDQVAGR